MSHTGVPDRRDPAPASNERLRRVKIRVSLFFDGTLNNRTNTRLRVRAPQAYRRVSGGDGSYESDESNVARLEPQVGNASPGYDYYIKVYIEGIGTTDLGRDSQAGYALGMYGTGIEAKVRKGIAAAVGRIAQLRLNRNNTEIALIAVDTCGFSRGAAAARHCVYRILNTTNNLRVPLLSMGYRVGQVTVLAVGLFDTVASHGTVYWNDTYDLGLDAIRQAAAVYQLAAAEEYRARFSLTNIDSAGGKGRQVFLPGAHSDIGGSYVENADEQQTLVVGGDSAAVARFMLTRGWYQGGPRGPELVYTPAHAGGYSPYGNTTVLPGRVTVRRGPIRQAYSFIPLRLMADWLKDRGVPVLGQLYTRFNPRDVPGAADIVQYAKNVGVSRITDWDRTTPTLAALRHGYLHVSFRDEFAHQVNMVRPRNSPAPRPTRHVYDG